MKVIDMHCDTLSELLGRRERGKAAGLRQNDCHVDLLRMKESRYLLQNFAMFVVLEGFGDPWERVCALHRYYQEELESNQDILAPVLRFSEIILPECRQVQMERRHVQPERRHVQPEHRHVLLERLNGSRREGKHSFL